MIKFLKRCTKWLWEKLPDSKLFRLFCLIACAAFGFYFWRLTLSNSCDNCELFGFNWSAVIDEIKTEHYAKRFAHPFALSLFVLLALWYFRTRDTLRRIAGADAQIQQSNFTIGLTNLVAGKSINIEIGVAILLQVSDATDAFDKQIRIAFIRRLKDKPLTNDDVHIGSIRRKNHFLSYAQHMLKWLINYQIKNPESDKPDLRGMSCDYQEFTSADIGDFAFSKILPTDSEIHEYDRVGGYKPPITFLSATSVEKLDFENVSKKVVDSEYHRLISWTK